MELLRGTQSSRGLHLAFADHMHELNTSKRRSSRPEGLEPHHRSHLTLDRAVVLFNNIVEVLDLPDFNLGVVLLVVVFDCCAIGAAPVDGNLHRRAMSADCLAQEAQGCFAISLRSQQEIDGVPYLVDGPILILPSTFDPHIGFVHSPTTTDTTFPRAKGLVQQWHILDHPMIETGVVDFHASLRPVIDRTFKFDDMAEVHRYLESSEQFGKIVVTL
jgi:Zinc-binding dehydrogenase